MRSLPTLLLAPLVLLVLLGSLACGPAGEPDPRARPDTAASPAGDPPVPPPPSSGPGTRTDTILVEGMPEPITLHAVAEPAGFPVRFTTWVPDGWVVETERAPAAVRFVAAFGGTPDPSAFLEVGIAPEGATFADAVARARDALGDGAVPVPAGERRHPWSLEELRLEPAPGADVRFGHVAVGRHGRRYFHVLTTMPAEYADGFGPRARPILEEWRWADGSPLGG